MKKIALFTMALVMAASPLAFATGKQVICYTASGGNTYPFYGASQYGGRFQQLIYEAVINYAGKINEVEWFKYAGSAPDGATYKNVKVYLCHTDRTGLSTTFEENYKGTPVLVASHASLFIPPATNWFPLKLTTPFTYNDTDNLLVEIQWSDAVYGTSCSIYTGVAGTGARRCYAWGPEPSTLATGSADTVTYYTRLSFGAYTAVTPTSLGRVKTLFR